MILGSDIYPFEVVRQISDITLEVRQLDTELIQAPQNFQIGGFAAHCVDNHNQKYSYRSNPTNGTMRIRFSRKRGQWHHKGTKFMLLDEPLKFHDYNF